MTTQHGYLVLADISGYTAYLAGSEFDHAHDILTDLLEGIVQRFRTALTIAKLEGDAAHLGTLDGAHHRRSSTNEKRSRGNHLLCQQA